MKSIFEREVAFEDNFDREVTVTHIQNHHERL